MSFTKHESESLVIDEVMHKFSLKCQRGIEWRFYLSFAKKNHATVLVFFSVAAWLPRWAARWHCHAPEQRHPAAACVRARQQRVSALPLPARQDFLLRPRRVPPPPRRRPAGQLLRLLGFPGGPERRHGPSHSGSVCTTWGQSDVSGLRVTFRSPQVKGTWSGLTSQNWSRSSRSTRMWRRWPTATCSTLASRPWGRSSSCTQSTAAGSALTSTTASPLTWGRAVTLM